MLLSLIYTITLLLQIKGLVKWSQGTKGKKVMWTKLTCRQNPRLDKQVQEIVPVKCNTAGKKPQNKTDNSHFTMLS